MKKITVLLLAFILLLSNSAVYAAYDYSAMLTDLSRLLDECSAMGISTDYETVNYKVIERFEQYMNDDTENDVDAEILTYNDRQIQRLYNETKTKLEAYINRSESPKQVMRPDMANISKRGSVLYDGENPVLSVGYGHFGLAQKDVDVFQEFGTNNIQIEVGPTDVKNEIAGWIETPRGDPDITVQVTSEMKKSGTYSLAVNNKASDTQEVYYKISQKIKCKPNTTYKFGCESYAPTMSAETYISANGFNDRNRISASSSWIKNEYTYTSTADQTELDFTILISGTTLAFFDDCFLYELGADAQTNLLSSPGFEDGMAYSKCQYVLDTLEAAEKSNIGVTLLLSPHYFPQDIIDTYGIGGNSGFIKYNINAPKAIEVIKNYLDTLLPMVAKYESLVSVCLSNEPEFDVTAYPDFYNPLFRDYLKRIHGTIEKLNDAYGTSYEDFTEVNMPADLTAYDAVSYDLMCYNDEVLAKWHEWMAGIVKIHLPGVPIHSKMLENFTSSIETADRAELMNGVNLELMGSISDWAGNDSWDVLGEPNTYYETMFTYDYQHSAVGKPVYNSENHIMRPTSAFENNQRLHAANNIWQGAIHGRSMATVWGWARTYDSSSSLYKAALSRPDVIAEIGKTSLDLTRLSDRVTLINQKMPDVAIWYSKPSRLYDAGYSKKLINVYKALLNIGQRPGVISDLSIDQLSKYKVLIIPGAEYCTEKTLAAVNSFIAAGKKVIYSGNAFAYDEYKKPLDNSKITSSGYEYSDTQAVDISESIHNILSDTGIQRVTIKDSTTGEIPDNVDWSYYLDNSKLIVNVSNLSANNTQNISVYLDGEKVSSMNELITGTTEGEKISVTGYIPKLLEHHMSYSDNYINSISSNGEIINWTYVNNNSNTANVYKMLANGMLGYMQTVNGNSYTCQSNGTYVVKALSGAAEESKGKFITISDSDVFEVSIISENLKNNSATCEIKINNNLSTYAVGILRFSIKNQNGDMVDSIYYTPVLGGGKSTVITVSMPVKESNYSIEAVMKDSRTEGNTISNTILLNV